MYVPSHFEAKDADALVDKLARGVATLVSVDADGRPIASHLPILWDAEKRIARGHIARANPHWRLGAGKGLFVLMGADAYVSPGFYPSKAEHGKVVPTWNYETVHLSGEIEWFDDAVRLEALVRDLSALHEAKRPAPWSIDDAPRSYIENLLRAIVGVEMRVERVEAKQKLSQNKSAADFDGVVRGLAADASESSDVAALMSKLKADTTR